MFIATLRRLRLQRSELLSWQRRPRRAAVIFTLGMLGLLFGATSFGPPVARAQNQQADVNSMQDQSRQDTRQVSPAARAGARIETNVIRREGLVPRSGAAANLSLSPMDTSRYDGTQGSASQPADNTTAYPSASSR
jgi:hypothetical protein